MRLIAASNGGGPGMSSGAPVEQFGPAYNRTRTERLVTEAVFRCQRISDKKR
jgi:hypothetical protein